MERNDYYTTQTSQNIIDVWKRNPAGPSTLIGYLDYDVMNNCWTNEVDHILYPDAYQALIGLVEVIDTDQGGTP